MPGALIIVRQQADDRARALNLDIALSRLIGAPWQIVIGPCKKRDRAACQQADYCNAPHAHARFSVTRPAAQRRLRPCQASCIDAVTSISIFMRSSSRPAISIVAAGRAAPRYFRQTGQHSSKLSLCGTI